MFEWREFLMYVVIAVFCMFLVVLLWEHANRSGWKSTRFSVKVLTLVAIISLIVLCCLSGDFALTKVTDKLIVMNCAPRTQPGRF